MSATSPARLVLGVDGGSSKTVALVADTEGCVLGSGRAGNADIYVNAQAIEEVAAAITAALDSAGAKPADLAAAALSLVGADWPEDFDLWRGALGRLGLGHLEPGRALIVNDAIGALTAGAPDGPAMVVVCGTGTATGARGPTGREWHSSFWQRTQGGKEIGERALDAVYLAELGIGPPTIMTDAMLTHFDVSSVENVLHGFTKRVDHWRRRAADLAPLILDAAAAGDETARSIVLGQAEALAGYAIAGARLVGLDRQPARLVLAGGVFRHPSRLMPDHLVACIRAALPMVGIEVVTEAPEPVVGATLLALGALGLRPVEPLRDRLRVTCPPVGFFHTAGGRAA